VRGGDALRRRRAGVGDRMIHAFMGKELIEMTKNLRTAKCPRCAADVPGEKLIVNRLREIVGCEYCLGGEDESGT